MEEHIATCHAGCTAWKCREMIFPLDIQNFTLLTRTKGMKRKKAFSEFLFLLLVNESNFPLAMSAVVNMFCHYILLCLFTGERFDGRALLFSPGWYPRHPPTFCFSLMCPCLSPRHPANSNRRSLEIIAG